MYKPEESKLSLRNLSRYVLTPTQELNVKKTQEKTPVSCLMGLSDTLNIQLYSIQNIQYRTAQNTQRTTLKNYVAVKLKQKL